MNEKNIAHYFWAKAISIAIYIMNKAPTIALHYFWAKAISITIYIMNKAPTIALHGMMPKQKFAGTKLNIAHLKVFGYITYVHVLDEVRTKLDPKAKKYIFIGYSLEQKAYRCYNPMTCEI